MGHNRLCRYHPTPQVCCFCVARVLPRINTFRPPPVESEAFRHTSVPSAPSRPLPETLCLVYHPVGVPLTLRKLRPAVTPSASWRCSVTYQARWGASKKS